MVEFTAEQIRQIEYNAKAAGALLFMVPLYVKIGGEDIHTYVAPWNCLDVAAQFHKAGATLISLSPAFSPDWHWFKPAPRVRARRKMDVHA